MARTTSGGMIEPPSTVTTPTPLMTGLTPSLAYKVEGEEAVRLALVAAAAAAGDIAAVSRRRRRVSFMTNHYMMPLCASSILLDLANTLLAQTPYDLLLKGAHVIDPKNKDQRCA